MTSIEEQTKNLKIGETYNVTHIRKGKFSLKILDFDDTWVSGIIIKGKAKAIREYNERHEGEDITIRREFSTFTLPEPPKKEVKP